MPVAEGAVFGGYTIIRLLGTGGMGEVYLAQHPRLPLARLIDDAGLPRRHALLAVDQFDLEAIRRPVEPARLRWPRRAHLDVHLAPPVRERIVQRAAADPVHITQAHAHGAQPGARTDDDPVFHRVSFI